MDDNKNLKSKDGLDQKPTYKVTSLNPFSELADFMPNSIYSASDKEIAAIEKAVNSAPIQPVQVGKSLGRLEYIPLEDLPDDFWEGINDYGQYYGKVRVQSESITLTERQIQLLKEALIISGTQPNVEDDASLHNEHQVLLDIFENDKLGKMIKVDVSIVDIEP